MNTLPRTDNQKKGGLPFNITRVMNQKMSEIENAHDKAKRTEKRKESQYKKLIDHIDKNLNRMLEHKSFSYYIRHLFKKRRDSYYMDNGGNNYYHSLRLEIPGINQEACDLRLVLCLKDFSLKFYLWMNSFAFHGHDYEIDVLRKNEKAKPILDAINALTDPELTIDFLFKQFGPYKFNPSDKFETKPRKFGAPEAVFPSGDYNMERLGEIMGKINDDLVKNDHIVICLRRVRDPKLNWEEIEAPTEADYIYEKIELTAGKIREKAEPRYPSGTRYGES